MPNSQTTTRSGLKLAPCALIAFLLTFCIIGTPANLTSADEPLPDDYNADYNFFSGIPFELTNLGRSLPGSNDWNCVPPQEHPDPIVLVHGTGGGAQQIEEPLCPTEK